MALLFRRKPSFQGTQRFIIVGEKTAALIDEADLRAV